VLAGNNIPIQIENISIGIFTLPKLGQASLLAPLHKYTVGDIRKNQLLLFG
jgi:hypothetical protein